MIRHVAARHHAARPGIVATHVDGFDGQHDLARMFHRFGRVGDEVVQGLVEFHPVDAYLAAARTHADIDLDVRPHVAPRSGRHLAKIAPGLDVVGLPTPARRECQRVLDDLGTAFGGLERLGHFRLAFLLGHVVAIQGELGEGDDRLQHVVQFVREAARERAHGRHLVAFPELLLHLATPGDGVLELRDGLFQFAVQVRALAPAAPREPGGDEHERGNGRDDLVEIPALLIAGQVEHDLHEVDNDE